MVRRLLRRREMPRVVLWQVHHVIDALIADPEAKGVLVYLGSTVCGWAHADALRAELERARTAGKIVLVQAETHVANREALIASGGTKLIMTPPGLFTAIGTSTSGLFYRAVLARLGVQVEVASAGQYKSAPERFTRDDRSEADLEQTTRLIDQFDARLASAWSVFRGVELDTAIAHFDRAPLIATRALELGLIDGLARDDEILKALDELGSPGPIVEDRGPKSDKNAQKRRDQRGRRDQQSRRDRRDRADAPVAASTYLQSQTIPPLFRRPRKRIGVVEVHGAIVDTAPFPSPPGAKTAIAKHVVDDLRTAGEDDTIAAVILHVNSRGGSVTASDQIFGAVRRLNQTKPVIACFDEVAASGGYYVACGARKIFAVPLTITGSIGVFALTPIFEDLIETLGLGHDLIKNRRNAGIYDVFRSRSEDERQHARDQVQALYALFIDLVARARTLDTDSAEGWASGRVWTGQDALERKLVDGLGGLEEAFAHAKEVADGTRFEPEPEIVHAPRPNMMRPPPVDEAGIGQLIGERFAEQLIERFIAKVTGSRTSTAIVSEILSLLSTGDPTPGWLWTPFDVR
ncbi:MAG: signal peptide peptidase SppA [Deltaproteobacteria bacterium]|nr:signal peptide peptidase SppA [Deltaproteobacteria bacterium]